MGLPDHHHQAPARPQRPPDVGERGHRFREEHRAEPADRQVETLPPQAADLRVGLLEGDVAHPLRLGQLARPLDGGPRDVDPERAAGRGHARDLAGRLPAPAADVEDDLTRLDAIRPSQDLVVPPQLVVVVDETSLRAGSYDARTAMARRPVWGACGNYDPNQQ